MLDRAAELGEAADSALVRRRSLLKHEGRGGTLLLRPVVVERVELRLDNCRLHF